MEEAGPPQSMDTATTSTTQTRQLEEWGVALCRPIQVSSRVTPCHSNKADHIPLNNSKDPTATIRARQWAATTTIHPCNITRAMARRIRGRQALTCSSMHAWLDHLNNSKTGTINNLPTTSEEAILTEDMV